MFIETCVSGLVLRVTRILRAALTKFRVCLCNYSSQTTERICVTIIPANRASYCRLLRFELFTSTIYKTQNNQKWAWI